MSFPCHSVGFFCCFKLYVVVAPSCMLLLLQVVCCCCSKLFVVVTPSCLLLLLQVICCCCSQLCVVLLLQVVCCCYSKLFVVVAPSCLLLLLVVVCQVCRCVSVDELQSWYVCRQLCLQDIAKWLSRTAFDSRLTTELRPQFGCNKASPKWVQSSELSHELNAVCSNHFAKPNLRSCWVSFEIRNHPIDTHYHDNRTYMNIEIMIPSYLGTVLIWR